MILLGENVYNVSQAACDFSAKINSSEGLASMTLIHIFNATSRCDHMIEKIYRYNML